MCVCFFVYVGMYICICRCGCLCVNSEIMKVAEVFLLKCRLLKSHTSHVRTVFFLRLELSAAMATASELPPALCVQSPAGWGWRAEQLLITIYTKETPTFGRVSTNVFADFLSTLMDILWSLTSPLSKSLELCFPRKSTKHSTKFADLRIMLNFCQQLPYWCKRPENHYN